MQKRTLGLILTIIGLAILVSGIAAYTVSTTQTHTVTLPISDGLSVPLELSAGDKVQGAVTVLNGNEGINVYVENPQNEVIYNGGTVYSNVEFSFNAQTFGSYAVIINNLSSTNGQTIEYSLTYPSIPSIVGLALIIVGVFFVVAGVTMRIMLQKAGAIKQVA